MTSPAPTIHTLRQRRFAAFKANRRGYISAILLLVLFTLSLFAELIANDKPLLVYYKDNLLIPIMHRYTEKDTFGGVMESEADYADPWVMNEISAHGWMLRAPIPYDYRSINFHSGRAPSPPLDGQFAWHR